MHMENGHRVLEALTKALDGTDKRLSIGMHTSSNRRSNNSSISSSSSSSRSRSETTWKTVIGSLRRLRRPLMALIKAFKGLLKAVRGLHESLQVLIKALQALNKALSRELDVESRK